MNSRTLKCNCHPELMLDTATPESCKYFFFCNKELEWKEEILFWLMNQRQLF